MKKVVIDHTKDDFVEALGLLNYKDEMAFRLSEVTINAISRLLANQKYSTSRNLEELLRQVKLMLEITTENNEYEVALMVFTYMWAKGENIIMGKGPDIKGFSEWMKRKYGDSLTDED